MRVVVSVEKDTRRKFVGSVHVSTSIRVRVGVGWNYTSVVKQRSFVYLNPTVDQIPSTGKD
jgi:hypothetical protein